MFRNLLLAIAFCATPVAAQDHKAVVDQFYSFLAEQDNFQAFAAEQYGFTGEAAAVYADHLGKTWSDPVLRGFLVDTFGPDVTFKEDGNVSDKSLQQIMDLQPSRIMLYSALGAARLTPDQLATYMRALHKGMYLQASQGPEACAALDRLWVAPDATGEGESLDQILEAMIGRFKALNTLDAKTLHAFLQVHREAARKELQLADATYSLEELGLETANTIIDQTLDQMVIGHPSEALIKEIWFNGSDDPVGLCEATKLDLQVLDQLGGDALGYASLYFIEFLNGKHQ